MKPLAEHELAGTLQRGELKRRRAEADVQAPQATPEERAELARINGLIDKVIAACRHGSTVRGKSNPAFGQLRMLVDVRRKLLKDIASRPARKKTAAELLRESDDLLGGVN